MVDTDARPARACFAFALLVLAAVAAPPSVTAADGAPDPSFVGAGMARYPWDSGGQLYDSGRALVADDAGNLFLVGSFNSIAGDDDWGVVKTDRFGTVILTQYLVFDLGGTNADVPMAIALDGSGGLVIAGQARGANGSSEVRICRLHASDLSLDTSFAAGAGCAGYTYAGLPLYAQAMARASDGGWLVAGGLSWGANDSDAFVVKFTSAGALDASFNALDPFHPGLTIVPVDLVANGTDLLRGLAVDHHGRILLVGDAQSPVAPTAAWVVRLTATGVVDSSFAASGLMSWIYSDPGPTFHLTRATSLAVDPLLDSFVVGYNHETATANELVAKVAHFAENGNSLPFPGGSSFERDVTWQANDGNPITGVIYQCDGQLLVVGATDAGDTLRVTRLEPNGTIDVLWGTIGVASFSLSGNGLGTGSGPAWADLSSGRLVLIGSTTTAGNRDWIAGRFTDRLVACDAFESGTRSGWSASSP